MKRFFSLLFAMTFLIAGFNTMVFAEGTSDGSTENVWEYETPMEVATHGGSATVVGDKIYYIGGYGNPGGCISNTQIYDTKTKLWTMGEPMNIARAEHSSIAYNNKIYVLGGMDTSFSGAINSLEIYDTETNTWTTGANMLYPSSNFATVLVGDKIYVYDGIMYINGVIQRLNKLQVYDIKNDQWSIESTLPFEGNDVEAGSDGTNIYVIGARDITSKVYVYNTVLGTWSSSQSEVISTRNTNCTTVGNKIYTICNETNAYNKKVVSYDMSTDIWDTLPDVNLPRANSSMASVGNKIYILGGVIDAGTQTPTVESFAIKELSSGNRLSVLLNIGESVKLSVSNDVSNNLDCVWTSSDESIATVDSSGVVTAANAGSAKIYAENGEKGFSEYIPVIVVETADETRLAVNLDLNQTKKLYLNDDIENITWSSNDDSIVTVTEDGKIKGISNGLAIVNALYDNENYQMYVRVKTL